jgi:ABC-type branched-subunit amino acid transport system ATPase component
MPLDKPTEGILRDIIRQIGAVIARQNARGDMAIVPVGRQLGLDCDFADWIHVCNRGAVSEAGATGETPVSGVRGRPLLRREA